MEQPYFLISDSEFVLKTTLQTSAKGIMRKRYASAVIIVLSGTVCFQFPETSVCCSSGNAIFIPKGTTYRFLCHENAESLIVNLRTVKEPDSHVMLGNIGPQTAIRFFENMERLLLNPTQNRNQILAEYYRLLSLFLDKREASVPAARYVQRAESIIREQFAFPELSCARVAKELNISEVYLRKLFIKQRGISPSHFLISVRMEYAKHLLLEGHSVAAAAEQVGYRDIFQFSRAYKRHFGFSPTQTPMP